jgi:lysylphosphatidylglycerol synthetase-like protein (DUF2156 family)
MNWRERQSPDPMTQATVTVAWVIIANKPFYPFYVWWLVGSGVGTSMATLVSIPFFAAIPPLASRSPFLGRLALPLVGALDTVFETAIFGRGSATLLFLAPCVTLATVSFHAVEKWWQRGLACFIFVCFAGSWRLIDRPVFPWSTDQLATLANINVLAVASLMTFIALRYAGLPHDTKPSAMIDSLEHINALAPPSIDPSRFLNEGRE